MGSLHCPHEPSNSAETERTASTEATRKQKQPETAAYPLLAAEENPFHENFPPQNNYTNILKNELQVVLTAFAPIPNPTVFKKKKKKRKRPIFRSVRINPIG